MENQAYPAFLAGEDLEAKRRVKIKAGTVTDPPEIEYADAGEDCIGVTVFSTPVGEPVTVRLLNDAGIFEMECVVDSAIAYGTVLYGAADGMVSDEASGTAIGVSVSLSPEDNEHISVILWSLKGTTGATVSIADTGTFTSASTVEAALAEIYQHLLSAHVTIPIPLAAITQEDGTALTKQATTVAGFSQLADKETVINIPVNCTAGESLGFSVPIPQDLDDTADIEIHVLAGKAANLDVLTLDCEVYPVAVGDLANADIQDTAAQTIVATGTELVFVCGADGVLAAPGTLSVVLAVGGTNDGDAVYIYGVWIEYKRKVLTA